MKGILPLVVSAFLLLTTGLPASADKRVALVIGNSAYRHAPKLTNTANDALAVSTLLKAAGFDTVASHQDLTGGELRRALRDFSDSIRDADIALVFYAGHGIEVGGVNYLIPVDARLERDIDVEDEAVSLDRVMMLSEPAKRLRLVILDACRDNPFMRTMTRTMASRSIGRGLAKVEPTTSDTLIAFAAKAGSVAFDGDGVHSPFTTALIQHMTTPGLDVRLAFGRVRDDVIRSTKNRQEPYVYGSLGGANLALVPTPDGQGRSGILDAIPQKPDQAVARDYELAAKVGTRDAWDAFLIKYPEGFYADLARAQRAKSASLQPAPAVKPPPKPDPKEQKKAAGSLLRECLAGYVRRQGPFVPEGQSTREVKSRSDMTSMCNFAISQRNYYWRHLR